MKWLVLLWSISALGGQAPFEPPVSMWTSDGGGNPIASLAGGLDVNFGSGSIVPNANAAAPFLPPIAIWIYDGYGNPISSSSNALNVNCISGCSSGGVTGPSSSVSGDLAEFNGTNGQVIEDSGLAPSTAAYSPSTVVERDSSGLIEDFMPSYVLNLFEDFTGYQATSNNGLFQSASSGTSASACPAGGSNLVDNAHPGICQLTTGTTSTGSSMTFTGLEFTWGAGAAYFDALVYFPTICDSSTNTCTVWIGFGNSFTPGATELTNGVWFEWNPTVNSGNLEYCSGVGTTVCNNSSTTIASATWYHFTISINAAGTGATWSLNGAQVGSISSSTKIPVGTTSSNMVLRITKTAGTTARVMDVDYIRYREVFTTPR